MSESAEARAVKRLRSAIRACKDAGLVPTLSIDGQGVALFRKPVYLSSGDLEAVEPYDAVCFGGIGDVADVDYDAAESETT